MTEIKTFSEKVIENLEKVVVGKRPSLELIVIGLLCQGHVLIEDVPGVGKTVMARSLARSLDCSFNRIQFTPDMLPSDVTGVSIYNQKKSEFEFRPGPIMGQVILADEINRATPKTQAALLEAMEEHQVTVDGTTHMLPRPFMVLATQNPIEYEGTFPLPEAQLDRFLLQIDVSYPDIAAERRMLFATTGVEERKLEAIFSAQELMAAQRLVRQIPVPDKVVEAILKLVRSARPDAEANDETRRFIAWGPGPRASQALTLAVRAKALIDGRLAPSVDDVVALAEPVLKHRMALSFTARTEGQEIGAVIARLTQQLE
jgi:MoxR-like ATPase